MVFKIDIDGVLRDIITPMCRLYSKEVGREVKPEEITDYSVEKSFSEIANPREFFFEKRRKEIFFDALPFDGAVEAMQRMRELGHKIRIVTFQNTHEARLMTLEWLEKHKIIFDSIVFTVTNEKRGIDGDVLIEDCSENLRKEDSAKTLRVCIDRPYNCLDSNNYIRVSSLLEFVEKYVEPEKDAKEKDC